MVFEIADKIEKETEGNVRCLRAQMKLCADPECYHSEPHKILDNSETETDCTKYEQCKTRNVVTRCTPYVKK